MNSVHRLSFGFHSKPFSENRDLSIIKIFILWYYTATAPDAFVVATAHLRWFTSTVIISSDTRRGEWRTCTTIMLPAVLGNSRFLTLYISRHRYLLFTRRYFHSSNITRRIYVHMYHVCVISAYNTRLLSSRTSYTLKKILLSNSVHIIILFAARIIPCYPSFISPRAQILVYN